MSMPFALTGEEQRYLGRIARLAVEQGFAGADGSGELPEPPSPVLREKLGVFVTLTIDGRLRGCIGSLIGREPLYLTTARTARAAAFEDTRFAPLQAEEWPHVALDISVLGPLSRCPDPSRIEIGRHGLFLVRRGRSGVFLPQVPVEQGWSLPTYLERLCDKAGLPSGSWAAPDAELYWYEAFVFTPPREDAGDAPC